MTSQVNDLKRLEPLSTTATVANYFISLVPDLTHMKLQKLVFFAHGWCLALLGRRLIDEPVQAWKYGPVIETLYRALKRFGSDTIPTDERVGSGESEPPQEVRALLDKVLEAYGGHDAITLSRITHLPDAPWTHVYDGSHDRAISDRLIGEYFQNVS